MSRNVPSPPDWQAPPGGETITLHLKLITPMFGGGYEPREVDTVNPIRAASIRGHLRFWWRALYGGSHRNAAELLQAEEKLWGTMETPGQVGIRITTTSKPVVENSDVSMGAPDAYALWPARATWGDTPQPAAQRLQQDFTFQLTCSYPKSLSEQVRQTLTAWVLFGGIGGRTRRGCGSLTVLGNEAGRFLPKRADAGELIRLLPAMDPAGTSPKASQLPLLAGADLAAGSVANRSALQAWYEALKWLREFRQGHSGPNGGRAREPDPDGRNRPSVSNWPEADKVRHLVGKPNHLKWAHQPRHNSTPAWPRASFGLPIIGQFQQKTHTNQRWSDHGEFEPKGFEIIWRDSEGAERERLASPLIIKPMALATGEYVACALWLRRAYPQGKACIRGRRGSEAPFDQLVAPGDSAKFSPLRSASSMREAFLTWLKSQRGVKGVLP
jgi:CRISPR-associated protein Cmr1